jgi:hypothetical protein
MATPIGTNVINSVSRRWILPTLFDNTYKSNLVFFRLVQRNKKIVQGGFQIEVPLIYGRFAAGGFYQGYDLLDVSPSDTVKNAAFDWKQAYVPVTIDNLSLMKSDSPEAIINFLTFYFEQAQMELAEILGTGVWGTGSNPKSLDSIPMAVDDGSTTSVYGGLTRSSTVNPWWRANVDSTTTTLTLVALQTMFGNCTFGARHPTLIATSQLGYNRYWNLSTGGQSFPVQPGGHDEILAQNGFTNLLFNNVPVAVDSHVSSSTTVSPFFFLNEDYMYLFVNPRADFKMDDFREPTNQDAMTSLIKWAGDLALANCGAQGKMTAIAA